MNLILINSNFVLKIYLSTLQTCSRNYYISEIAINRFHHSSEIMQNLNKPMQCTKEIFYSTYYIMRLPRDQNMKGTFPWLSLKEIIYCLSKFLPYYFLEYLDQFFGKARIKLGSLCAQGSNWGSFFLTKLSCTFHLRVEIQSLRKGMYIVTVQLQSFTTL